jgi:molybdopterin/thiamine biosynthesis adenylyltransferase
MQDSAKLLQELRELEAKRKNGEISAREFYQGLLEILGRLKDFLVREDINEQQVKKQIPLLLAFIKSQISEMEMRGH